MSTKLQIHTRVRRLFHYIDDFQKGIIRVPAFQREFVWKMKDKLDLFDSINNGYPIGSILFWRPDIKADGDFFQYESEKIGSYFIPDKSQDFFYILDGYQRISALFGSLVNPYDSSLIRDDEQWYQEYNLIYNLKDDKFERNKKRNLNDLEIFKVPLYKFVDSKEFFGFQKTLYNSNLSEDVINDYIRKYENLSSRLFDYQVPSIDIIGGNAVAAVEIFSRVNSTGVRISDDWKISALSFNPERNFKLGTEISNLLESLKIYNFNTLKRNLILQCIVNSFGKVFFDQSNPKILEDLAIRDDFIDITRKTLENIRRAVKFLFEDLYVLSSKLLPYNNQLIFITDFFTKTETPNLRQLQSLKRWFWITSYSGYFTMYNLSKQRTAYNQFQDFIYGNIDDPVYNDNPIKKFSVSSFPIKINMGSVRAKSLALFMLNHHNNLSNNLKKFKIIPLFKFLNSNDETNVTENTVILIYTNSSELPRGQIKDLSSMLYSDENTNGYFLTEEMKNLFKSSQDRKQILDLRKQEIVSAERAFVENLGLSYE